MEVLPIGEAGLPARGERTLNTTNPASQMVAWSVAERLCGAVPSATGQTVYVKER